MATFKNKRPTIIHLPDGTKAGPGETFTIDAKHVANPGMRILEDAGYVERMADGPDSEAPKAPEQADPDAEKKAAKVAAKAAKEAEKAAAKAREDKLNAIKGASEEALLKMAEGEADLEMVAAINARASELAGAAAPTAG